VESEALGLSGACLPRLVSRWKRFRVDALELAERFNVPGAPNLIPSPGGEGQGEGERSMHFPAPDGRGRMNLPGQSTKR